MFSLPKSALSPCASPRSGLVQVMPELTSETPSFSDFITLPLSQQLQDSSQSNAVQPPLANPEEQQQQTTTKALSSNLRSTATASSPVKQEEMSTTNNSTAASAAATGSTAATAANSSSGNGAANWTSGSHHLPANWTSQGSGNHGHYSQPIGSLESAELKEWH